MVRVGYPEWPPAAEEWRCAFVILGLGDDSVQFGRSIDAIAAIQNALRGIHSILDRSGVPLRWEGFDDEDGNDTGFPMYTDTGFGFAFQRRIERMILDEEAKLPGPTRERAERKRRERREARRMARPKPRKEPQVRGVNMPAPPIPPFQPERIRWIRWIAERKLQRRDAVGGMVLVCMGEPELPSGKRVWKCPFTIIGLGDDDSILFGYGDDSMAALQNALRGIRDTFEQSGVPLRWAFPGFEEDDTGFPMDTDRGYGLAFRRRMEQLILDEVAKLPGPTREREERERRERREARRKARAKPQPK